MSWEKKLKLFQIKIIKSNNVMKKKFYFENEDAENAHSEVFFQEQMIREGITEMTVLEAVPVPYSKADFVYCIKADTCYEKTICGKQCESYDPISKNGRCQHRGQYCDYGEQVILKIENTLS